MLKFFQLNLTFKYIDKYKVQSSTARKCWVGQKVRKLRLKPLKGRFWRHLVAILVQNNNNLKTKRLIGSSKWTSVENDQVMS